MSASEELLNWYNYFPFSRSQGFKMPRPAHTKCESKYTKTLVEIYLLMSLQVTIASSFIAAHSGPQNSFPLFPKTRFYISPIDVTFKDFVRQFSYIPTVWQLLIQWRKQTVTRLFNGFVFYPVITYFIFFIRVEYVALRNWYDSSSCPFTRTLYADYFFHETHLSIRSARNDCILPGIRTSQKCEPNSTLVTMLEFCCNRWVALPQSLKIEIEKFKCRVLPQVKVALFNGALWFTSQYWKEDVRWFQGS